MYHQYFGLTEAPFSIAVNPRYLFMSPRHRDALAHLLYGVGAGGGFILLTGEVGTGKTTINRCLLEQLPDDTDIAIILNPALNAMELLATVCDELGIGYDQDRHTLKTLTDSLHRYLLENYGRGRKTVLLIDEAQHLDFDVLEQVRLLTNLETNSEKLLQIILIGQPELAQMLGRPELRQLNQRITARYNLEPLSLEETGAYIRHRLQVAGMNPAQEVFPPGVVRGIHRYTRGIPRLINVLCDRMMLGAYGRNLGRTDQAMLRIAAKEVMGEEAAAGGEESTRSWPVIVVGALVVAVAAAWWWHSRQPVQIPSPQPGPAAEVAAVAVPETAQPAAILPEDTESQAAPQPRPEPQSPTTVPAVKQDMAPTAVAAAPALWMLAPTAALERLWALYSPAPLPLDLCSGELQEGLACVAGSARTWDELAEFDRPLVLDMITPERFSAGALFLGFNGRKALVATEEGITEVEPGELGPAWSGGYRFLWHPPEGFTRPLGLGDNSPAVAQVAALFARLDGQPQALAGTRFTPALQTRVRLFQREHALEDDGVVGMQTLLRLNEALGIDLTAATARAQLAAGADEGVNR
jgi:general secretion pathway protein A